MLVRARGRQSKSQKWSPSGRQRGVSGGLGLPNYTIKVRGAQITYRKPEDAFQHPNPTTMHKALSWLFETMTKIHASGATNCEPPCAPFASRNVLRLRRPHHPASQGAPAIPLPPHARHELDQVSGRRLAHTRTLSTHTKHTHYTTL